MDVNTVRDCKQNEIKIEQNKRDSFDKLRG